MQLWRLASPHLQSGDPRKPVMLMKSEAAIWRIPFHLWKPVFFVLVRPSTDWMRPTHIMKGRAPIAFTTVHILYHSDPLASHIQLTLFRNIVYRILVGHNFWGHKRRNNRMTTACAATTIAPNL